MSDAVLDDLARYERDRDDDERREIAIERLMTEYRSDAEKLGEVAAWLDGDTTAERRCRIHIGNLIRAALEYASGHASAVGCLVTLTHAGQVLSADPAFDAALTRLAERECDERAQESADFAGECAAEERDLRGYDQ